MANETATMDVIDKCKAWCMANQKGDMNSAECDSVSMRSSGTFNDNYNYQQSTIDYDSQNSVYYPRLVKYFNHRALQHQRLTAQYEYQQMYQNNSPFHTNPSTGPVSVSKIPLSHPHSLYHPEEFSDYNPQMFPPQLHHKQPHLHSLHAYPSQQDMHFHLPPVAEEASDFDSVSVKTYHTTSAVPPLPAPRVPPPPLPPDYRHSDHSTGTLFEGYSDTISVRTDNTISVFNRQPPVPITHTKYVSQYESNNSDTISVRTDNTFLIGYQCMSEVCSFRQSGHTKQGDIENNLIAQERASSKGPTERLEASKGRGAGRKFRKTQECCKKLRCLAGFVSIVSLLISGVVMYLILTDPFPSEKELKLPCNVRALIESHVYGSNVSVSLYQGNNITNCTTSTLRVHPTPKIDTNNVPLLYKHVEIEADDSGMIAMSRQHHSTADDQEKTYHKLKLSKPESGEDDRYSIVIPTKGIYFVYFGIYLVNNEKCSSLAKKTSEAYLYKMEQNGRKSQLSRSEHTCCEECDKDYHTGFTGGLFTFDENNTIFVKVSAPSLVQKGKSTYMGYFLLDNSDAV